MARQRIDLMPNGGIDRTNPNAPYDVRGLVKSNTGVWSTVHLSGTSVGLSGGTSHEPSFLFQTGHSNTTYLGTLAGSFAGFTGDISTTGLASRLSLYCDGFTMFGKGMVLGSTASSIIGTASRPTLFHGYSSSSGSFTDSESVGTSPASSFNANMVVSQHPILAYRKWYEATDAYIPTAGATTLTAVATLDKFIDGTTTGITGAPEAYSHLHFMSGPGTWDGTKCDGEGYYFTLTQSSTTGGVLWRNSTQAIGNAQTQHRCRIGVLAQQAVWRCPVTYRGRLCAAEGRGREWSLAMHGTNIPIIRVSDTTGTIAYDAETLDIAIGDTITFAGPAVGGTEIIYDPVLYSGNSNVNSATITDISSAAGPLTTITWSGYNLTAGTYYWFTSRTISDRNQVYFLGYPGSATSAVSPDETQFDYVDVNNYVQIGRQSVDGPIIAMVPLESALIVFCASSIWAISGTPPVSSGVIPPDFRVDRITSDYGHNLTSLCSPVVMPDGRTIVFANEAGLYALTGGQVQRLDGPIAGHIEYNPAWIKGFHVDFAQRLWVIVGDSSGTTPGSEAFVLNTKTNEWSYVAATNATSSFGYIIPHYVFTASGGTNGYPLVTRYNAGVAYGTGDNISSGRAIGGYCYVVADDSQYMGDGGTFTDNTKGFDWYFESPRLVPDGGANVRRVFGAWHTKMTPGATVIARVASVDMVGTATTIGSFSSSPDEPDTDVFRLSCGGATSRGIVGMRVRVGFDGTNKMWSGWLLSMKADIDVKPWRFK